ncbi:L-aspartate oxidase [Bacillus sp. BGMRC 2118]|nr:L-aspartate oxidase [Bacillus sp. BGMRC 2118]
MPKSDVVIIGSGLSALVAASRLCTDKNVIIFTKSKTRHSNSMLAQGGIASVIDEKDSWMSHFQDTLIAGCHHNEEVTLQQLVKDGPRYINELMNSGMKFDTDCAGKVLLGHEGAHSHRRILHAGGDATGEVLVTFLLQRLTGRCKIVENHMAVDLMMEKGTCQGIMALDDQNKLVSYYANHVILATGGCGAIYEYTSNDPSVIGDGYAMAFRAGAELIDMEFVQFHPTLLKSNNLAVGLISEAVRGEGAVLRLEDGTPIMQDIHILLDLAPRDVVSRAIYHEMKNGKEVFLDISMIQNFKDRFPTITKLCLDHGISIEKGLLPVVPGAHFMMGGIKVNAKGETNIPGLYAVGEVACTRVHGANRLASNSLLEGIVFANELANGILSGCEQRKHSIDECIDDTYIPNGVEPLSKEEIRKNMMKYVGIVRNKEGLEKVVNLFEPYVQLSVQRSWSKDMISRINMLTTGWLIASSALRREESRGGHYREDIPIQKDEWCKRTVVRHKFEVVHS